MAASCYLLSVSTRRMNQLVQSLGITGLSRSQVSQMAKELDEQVAPRTVFAVMRRASAGVQTHPEPSGTAQDAVAQVTA